MTAGIALTELIELFSPSAQEEGREHRPPWTWSALTAGERDTQARLIDDWVETYNRVLATEKSEIVPPCWRQHPGLATELAIQVWHTYAVHHHAAATVTAAADYYSRHLPGFRKRVPTYLGEAASDCLAGRHPGDWHQPIETVLDNYTQGITTDADTDALHRLGDLHNGFGPPPSISGLGVR